MYIFPGPSLSLSLHSVLVLRVGSQNSCVKNILREINSSIATIILKWPIEQKEQMRKVDTRRNWTRKQKNYGRTNF